MVSVRKRGKVYEYRIEIASIDGVRKWLTKSGFKTKSEALLAGQKAQAEYMSGETISKESQMTYGNYLDFWYENYCKNNYKYSTYKRYNATFNHLKKELGRYKISTLTGYQLNQFLLNMYMQNYTPNSIRNFQKVIKSSLNAACYHYGYIKNDPSAGIKLPRMVEEELKKRM